MQNANLHTNFIKQFRKQYTLCLCAQEYQYKNFHIRKFKGDGNEIILFEKWLVENLSHSEATDRVIMKLENIDNPCSRRLSGFVAKLVKQFSSHVSDEPFTAGYFNEILYLLKPFSLFINNFQVKVQQDVLNKLKLLFSNEVKEENTSFCSEDITDMQAEMEQYLNEIRKYYDKFNILFQHELNNKSSLDISSILEQRLLKLLMLMEQLILNSESTNDNLEECKTRLSIMEIKEIYN
ncbi:hypothetical protein [Segetibacter koreensis]|uniref:hypothetical protein n=1 Tax=Segetibacter koreensis TaxID=398037 RepID=UPI00039B39F9|nr:hypothetical protein [Segetibacter koreensis]